MTTQPNNKLLYALANTLGKPLAFVLRKQLGIVSWLVSKGWSRELSKLILKVFNVLILTAILFILFPSWMSLVGLFGAIFLYNGIEIDPPKQPQLRGGTDGFGYYNDSGLRVDGGSIEDETTYPKK